MSVRTVTLDAASLPGPNIQEILQSVIAPRPICFASTINRKGEVNLSPFSFFNLFSIQPPICIFSPSRRLRDNTTKHTLENVLEVPECVISIVNHAMVNQVSLASCDYPAGVNEFIKAGFTMVKSETVRPPRVAESPVQLECLVRQVIPLGKEAGSGNLVIAEIVKIHLAEHILDAGGVPDPAALDLVARLGGDWYARIGKENLFKVAKPNRLLGLGFDQLPSFIIRAGWLTPGQKAQLANLTGLPDPVQARKLLEPDILVRIDRATSEDLEDLKVRIVHLLNEGTVDQAALIVALLSPDSFKY